MDLNCWHCSSPAKPQNQMEEKKSVARIAFICPIRPHSPLLRTTNRSDGSKKPARIRGKKNNTLSDTRDFFCERTFGQRRRNCLFGKKRVWTRKKVGLDVWVGNTKPIFFDLFILREDFTIFLNFFQKFWNSWKLWRFFYKFFYGVCRKLQVEIFPVCLKIVVLENPWQF